MKIDIIRSENENLDEEGLCRFGIFVGKSIAMITVKNKGEVALSESRKALLENLSSNAGSFEPRDLVNIVRASNFTLQDDASERAAFAFYRDAGQDVTERINFRDGHEGTYRVKQTDDIHAPKTREFVFSYPVVHEHVFVMKSTGHVLVV